MACSQGSTVSPSPETNLLGVIVDRKQTYSNHIDFFVSKCDCSLFLIKQLRNMGMNCRGLKLFYQTKIRCILAYAAGVA